jgi:hypothetical protein
MRAFKNIKATLYLKHRVVHFMDQRNRRDDVLALLPIRYRT